MTITYRLSFWDRFAWTIYHTARSPIMLLIFACPLGLFAFNFMRSLPADRSAAYRIGVTAFGVVLMAAVFVSLWLVLVVLIMVSKKNKPLYCQRTLTVSDAGISTESEYDRSELKWTLVQRLARTRQRIFIYVNQQAAVVIPRRAFADAKQWDDFYEICQRGAKHVA